MSKLTITEIRDIEIRGYINDIAIFLSVPSSIESAKKKNKFEYLGYVVEKRKYKLQMINVHVPTVCRNVNYWEYTKWYGYNEFISFMDGILCGQSKKYLDKEDKIIQKMIRKAEKEERQNCVNLN